MAKRKKKPFPLLWLILGIVAAIGIILLLGLSLGLFDPAPTFEPTEEQSPAINSYVPEGFYREGEFLRYKEAEHLLGIDVSAHQGVIDWERVTSTGIDFAIIRIGYRGSTVGDLYEDEQFRYNLSEAKKYGLLVGAYFFSQALSEQEALDEARYACELLDGQQLDLPLYYDWEYVSDGRIKEMSAVPITDCSVAFCEEIRAQGYRAGVYFNQELGYHYLDMLRLQEYELWLAEYNEIPSFRYHFDCLQFTDNGSLDGIETTVDLDILFRQ